MLVLVLVLLFLFLLTVVLAIIVTAITDTISIKATLETESHQPIFAFMKLILLNRFVFGCATEDGGQRAAEHICDDGTARRAPERPPPRRRRRRPNPNKA